MTRIAIWVLVPLLAALWVFYDAEWAGNILTVLGLVRVIFGLALFWVTPAPYEYGVSYHFNCIGLILIISGAGSLVLAVLLCVTYILRLAALIFYKEVQNAEHG